MRLAYILLSIGVNFIEGQLIPPPGFIWKPGPLIEPSRGEVWPQVQKQTKSNQFLIVDQLQFIILGESCSILNEALDRYTTIIEGIKFVRPEFNIETEEDYEKDPQFVGYLFSLTVSLSTICSNNDFPTYDMIEEYTLNVAADGAYLKSESIWGILRGLESFSQLIYLSSDLKKLLVNVTEIHDFPRFPHRGLLLDTSRHYILQDYIFRLLDAMAYNKLNVFHFHITDDYSFPYESYTFPEMSKHGAFHKGMTYSQEFIKELQIYGQRRGIRIVPEFDTPGHTLSWGLGIPDLLTRCYDDHGNFTGANGPIDPTKKSTYEFLYKFFDEIDEVFIDKYLHIGGDEVDFSCWKSNKEITQWMMDNNMTGDYVALQSYYTQKVIDYISKKKQTIVWGEVFTTGVVIPKETVVGVWEADTCSDVMAQVTKAGYHAIVSCCWYLDKLANGGDWKKFYACDALNFTGTPLQKDLVFGGEAAMWSEVVDEANLEPRVWPRASAVAEKLWSAERDGTNIFVFLEAAHRLEEHTCRMNNRGIRAQPPTGPSICLSSTST